MKILIAYDGSQYSESAIDDLAIAGLPENGEALVVTVAEVWLRPPEASSNGNGTKAYIEEALKRHVQKGERLLNEATLMVNHAADRVRAMLPGWKVEAKSTYGSPAWEVLQQAAVFQPDLIIVGSHGQSPLSRLVLGSISQKVLNEAKCSVRVARGRVEVEPGPGRIILGYDGSSGAEAAVEAIVRRTWAPGTLVRMCSVIDSISPISIGRFIQPVSTGCNAELGPEHRWLSEMSFAAESKMREAGLNVEKSICEGNPKYLLVKESENWHADSIFVGLNSSPTGLGSLLLGSTAAAIASRAHCSVEVVRG